MKKEEAFIKKNAIALFALILSVVSTYLTCHNNNVQNDHWYALNKPHFDIKSTEFSVFKEFDDVPLDTYFSQI